MTIHLDTSALIDAITGPRRALGTLIAFADEGHRAMVSSIVLYEWLRGPRTRAELAAQEELFPGEEVVVFGPEQAALAARLYAKARRARGREIDLAIAACAMSNGAALWTLNRQDFADLEGLRLV